ncbi:MAG: hypothetical protein WAO98_01385 [Alphaproteobacteria bacterium]
MAFQLIPIPIVGFQDAFVIVPKAQLIRMCDLVLKQHLRDVKTWESILKDYPFRDRDGGIEEIPSAQIADGHYTLIHLSRKEQKILGVAKPRITMAELRVMRNESDRKRILPKRNFSGAWEAIAHPGRHQLLVDLTEDLLRRDHAMVADLCEKYCAAMQARDWLASYEQREDLGQSEYGIVSRIRKSLTTYNFDELVLPVQTVGELNQAVAQRLAGFSDNVSAAFWTNHLLFMSSRQNSMSRYIQTRQKRFMKRFDEINGPGIAPKLKEEFGHDYAAEMLAEPLNMLQRVRGFSRFPRIGL